MVTQILKNLTRRNHIFTFKNVLAIKHCVRYRVTWYKKHYNSGIGLKRILYYLAIGYFVFQGFRKDLLNGKYEIMKNYFAKQKPNLLIFFLLFNCNEGKINSICVFIKVNLVHRTTHYRTLGYLTLPTNFWVWYKKWIKSKYG